jgi:hypothetical protein
MISALASAIDASHYRIGTKPFFAQAASLSILSPLCAGRDAITFVQLGYAVERRELIA